MPRGCKAFGPGASARNVQNWLKPWLPNNSKFSVLLVLAGTHTAELQGISAAGSTPAARRYTAVADAELLLYGPSKRRLFPLPPLDAGVSPALISFVAARWLGVKPFVLAVGVPQVPPFPHLRIESADLGPSACITTGKSMDKRRVISLIEKGKNIGKQLMGPLVLCECVPGGTTTAQAALTGLGINVDGLISSSLLRPPLDIKNSVVSSGLRASGLDSSSSPEALMAAVGDPFQPVAVGILLGAMESHQSVFLGGGSQMIAVLSLALASLPFQLRSRLVDLVAIGTTSWLAEEVLEGAAGVLGLAGLMERISDYYSVKPFGLSAGLRFESSNHQSLRDYEIGYVKEGVGAGVLTFLAQLHGASLQELIQLSDQACFDLQKLKDEQA